MKKAHIKNFVFKGTKFTGIYNLTKKLKKGALALCYHGIENEIIDANVQEVHLSLDNFEKQINYLRRNFEIISLDYLCDCITNGYKIDPFQVLITFDDGYKNNINIVAPFLRSLNLPFSIFISTNHIAKEQRFPTYYLRASIFCTEKEYINIPSIKKEMDTSTLEKRVCAKSTIEKFLKTAPQHIVNLIVNDLIDLFPHDRWLELNNIFSSDEPMNWDDVKKLYDLGVTIGSHCHDHFILHSNQSTTEIDYQLKTSRDLIEKNLGQCKYIAYPEGGIDNITFGSLMSVKKYKYFLGFISNRGEIRNSSNQYLLPRIGASKDLDHFKFKINTGFHYNRKIHRWASKFNFF